MSSRIALQTPSHYKCKLAALTRDRQPDDPELVQARADFVAATIAALAVEIAVAVPILNHNEAVAVASWLYAQRRAARDRTSC